MNKAFLVTVVCIVSSCLVIGCQRAREYPGSEQYKPRPAPLDRDNAPERPLSMDVQGELTKVDLANKTFVIRVENGMEQTFKFDNETLVLGLATEPQPAGRQKPSATTNTAIRNLIGKEGSEVMVEWRTEGETKMANRIDVLQVSTSKSNRHHRK
jgi:hypothetical protein